jgi:hypothetical protein
VASCEQLVRDDARLPAVLKGQEKLTDPLERARFGALCLQKNLPAAAARLYQEALAAGPHLTGLRFAAAGAAAQAASGKGDAATLDDRERARWRGQALVWLRADVQMWRMHMESGPAQVRKNGQRALEMLKGRTDLAGVRDAAALAKLPAAEQQAWQALWAEVETLLQQARKKQP